MQTCNATIDLRKPVRSERVKDFSSWRTVYVYVCPCCKAERRVRANSFRGRNPEPGIGAIVCGSVLPPTVHAESFVKVNHAKNCPRYVSVMNKCTCGASKPETGFIADESMESI